MQKKATKKQKKCKKKQKKAKKAKKKHQKQKKNEKQKNRIRLDLKLVNFYYNYFSYNCNVCRISRQS